MEDFCDTHHLFWPRSWYKSKAERAFRNLPCHKVRLLRSEHNALHAIKVPPVKPSRDMMGLAVVAHYHKRCTCERGEGDVPR